MKSVKSFWAMWIHHSWGSLTKIQMNAAMPITALRVRRRGSQHIRTTSKAMKKYSNVFGNTNSNQRWAVISNNTTPTSR